ncbi:Type VIII secretion system (T8SS), CsgF protein [compost metagenome]
MNKNRLSLWLLGLGLAGSVQATELVYTPVNPAFGGNPLNGTWLLNNAQAQNDHDDPDSTGATRQSALERFTSSLESRLLSQMLSNIEDGNTGSLTTDSFIINMIDDGGQLTIMITDRATGEVSEVVVDGLLP